MGKFTTLSGIIKDEVSQMKLNVVHICSSKNTKTIDLAILKATTHTSHEAPSDKYVTFLQSTVNTSYGLEAIFAILKRLRVTIDVCVAAKCLIVLHKMIKTENGYEIKDGLGDISDNGHRALVCDKGESNLTMNDLNGNSSRFTRELSPWVQWYKQYLDRYFFTAEILGAIPNIPADSKYTKLETQRVLSLDTARIFGQTNFLIVLVEHISNMPETPASKPNKIVIEIKEIVARDYFSAMRLIKIRLEELSKRVTELNKMVPLLMRLETCKDGLSEFSWRMKNLVEDFWCLVVKLKNGKY